MAQNGHMELRLSLTPWGRGGWQPVDMFAVAALVSVASFVASNTLPPGPIAGILTLFGTASCGFSWLFARALFRPANAIETWPVVIVALLVVTGGLLDVFAFTSAGEGPLGLGLGMASRVHGLLSSTVLLLACLEAFFGFGKELPGKEKVFRLSFAAGYAALLAVSVVWLGGVAEGSWAAQSSDSIKTVCALAAIGFGLLTWAYRRANPLPKAKRRPRRRHAIGQEEVALGERIRSLVIDSGLYLEPELKLADLARRLGEAEYKVSQAITGALGFRNFNQMVNHHRIEAAKRALSDPERARQSVLSIALDSGFSSIGPFNRAFKAETGVTPSTFRASRA